MSMSILQRLKRLEQAKHQSSNVHHHQRHADRMAKYRHDPNQYAVDVLRVRPTPDQERIAPSLLTFPYRTLVKSGHNIGKTFLSAWIVNWWYDTRDPGVTITTAPTHRDVVDLLWTEVRLQRRRAGLPDHFIGPAAPEMRTSEEHYAKGYTSSTGESFQGRHREHMLFVFEEAEGIDGVYWETAGTMFQPDGTCAWLAILNPTTTTSASYQEEQRRDAQGRRKWNTFSVSSLNHPNIAAQLRGEPPLIPTAVTLDQVWQWLGDWFEPIKPDEADPEVDVEFPPGSGRWYHPGPEGESRVLGRRPSSGTYGVWSERLWASACQPSVSARDDWPGDRVPNIGADIARFGDDRTEIHGQCGGVSLLHEDHGGWDIVRTANRLMELADELSVWINHRRQPQAERIGRHEIPIIVDDTGVGGGVTDILRDRGFRVVAVNFGCVSTVPGYPRVRDELWFQTRELARLGKLDLSLLPETIRRRLEVQALAPTWKLTVDKKRSVEPKDETKKRIKKSPDGMDAFNLSHYRVGGFEVPSWVDTGPADGWRNRPMRRRDD